MTPPQPGPRARQVRHPAASRASRSGERADGTREATAAQAGAVEGPPGAEAFLPPGHSQPAPAGRFEQTATERSSEMASGVAPLRGKLAEPPSLELVLKRNGVERLKREKSPLGMLDELPLLIASGYADVPE